MQLGGSDLSNHSQAFVILVWRQEGETVHIRGFSSGFAQL